MSALQMNCSMDTLSSLITPTSSTNPLQQGMSHTPGVGGLNDAVITKTRLAQKAFVAVDILSISTQGGRVVVTR